MKPTFKAVVPGTSEFIVVCPVCKSNILTDWESFSGETPIDCSECEYSETHDLREE